MSLKAGVADFFYRFLPTRVKVYLGYLPEIDCRIKRQAFTNRIQAGLQKGAFAATLRQVNLAKPDSWEFSAFSQNGEDGILDVLTSQLKCSNKFFVEFGCGSIVENNTTFLALVKGFRGLMVDADANGIELGHFLLDGLCVERIELLNTTITLDSLSSILRHCPDKAPDVFSVDIDGNDFHIVAKIFELGFRPKIFVVEYNAAFGSESSVTVPYSMESFYATGRFFKGNYGCSFAAWKKFFRNNGYQMIAVDTQGVNIFFVAPEYFETVFLAGLDVPLYRPSLYLATRHLASSREVSVDALQHVDLMQV